MVIFIVFLAIKNIFKNYRHVGVLGTLVGCSE